MQFISGISQKNDPAEAAEDVIAQTLGTTQNKPAFILFFSTIHYMPNNGFKKMLDKIYEKIPKKTPLVGGTAAGFMNKKGQYSRGISLLVCFAEGIKVTAGIGKNTKNNPIKAARNASKDFQKGSNSAIIDFTSGPLRPNLPFIGNKFVVKSKTFSKILLGLMGFSTKYLQKGFGREEEVLEELAKNNSNSNIIGGSTCDDNKVINAFEFFNNEVYQNSTVVIQISGVRTKAQTIHGYDRTGRSFSVTNVSNNNRIVNEINGKPAVDEFCRLTDISATRLNESLHTKTFFIPFGYLDKVGFTCPMAVGGILGNSFYFSHGIRSHEMELLTSSGAKLKSETQNLVANLNDESIIFNFGIGCVSWIETLGRKIRIVKSQFDALTPDYLIVFLMGEDFYSPEQTDRHTNESFNTMSFFRE